MLYRPQATKWTGGPGPGWGVRDGQCGLYRRGAARKEKGRGSPWGPGEISQPVIVTSDSAHCGKVTPVDASHLDFLCCMVTLVRLAVIYKASSAWAALNLFWRWAARFLCSMVKGLNWIGLRFVFSWPRNLQEKKNETAPTSGQTQGVGYTGQT